MRKLHHTRPTGRDKPNNSDVFHGISRFAFGSGPGLVDYYVVVLNLSCLAYGALVLYLDVSVFITSKSSLMYFQIVSHKKK